MRVTHKPRGHWVRTGLKNGDLFWWHLAHHIVLSAPGDLGPRRGCEVNRCFKSACPKWAKFV